MLSISAPAAQPGSAESADLAARNLEQRLMTSGHERWEGDACTFCYLYIGIPISNHSSMSVCCLKRECKGCLLAAYQRGLLHSCPFCRTPFTNDEASDEASQLAVLQTRVDKDDAEAITFLGHKYYYGELGIGKECSSSDRIVEGGCRAWIVACTFRAWPHVLLWR